MMNNRLTAMVLALAACQCERSPVANRASTPPMVTHHELQTEMAAHFEAALRVQAAVTRGHLIEARANAALLARPTDHPAAWQPHVGALVAAARRIENARDLPAAAATLGDLGRACGACHEAERARVAFPGSAVWSGASDTIEAQMHRHEWAARRLWEGLIGPDATRWQNGAHAMAETRIDHSRLAHDKPNAEAIETAEQLTTIASRAVTLTTHEEQAAAYSELMTTCTSCHAVLRTRPVAND